MVFRLVVVEEVGFCCSGPSGNVFTAAAPTALTAEEGGGAFMDSAESTEARKTSAFDDTVAYPFQTLFRFDWPIFFLVQTCF